MFDRSEESSAVATVSASSSWTVAKPFKTVNRCFMPGDDITAAELEGSALDFDHMKFAGFIVAA